ncbi:peptide deformylase [Spiroplasma endosymbiont of Crioceris asparagi]|uniref:peptide deformylase n=1 Tax=Spiroplasma endosymbiont of Crioceris asparagi TaxID=3066286 RepID=UPI0030CCCF58
MEFLSKEKPTNKWLTKDNNPEIIRATSPDVKYPMNKEDDLCMKKLIDFVNFSQDEKLNAPEGTPEHLRPAVGLAAPQIGINKNMFYIKICWEDEVNTIDEYAVVNCKITARSEQLTYLKGGEGCLSVDGDRRGVVPRNYKIEVEFYDYLKDKNYVMILRGYTAIVFQHEYDHIIGKLYYDHINKEDPEYFEEDWIEI